LCLLTAVVLGTASLAPKVSATDPTPLPPIVHIFASDPDAAEDGCDPATFTVLRVGPMDAPLEVFLTVGGTATEGEDCGPVPRSIVIPAGEMFASFQATPMDDFLVEGWESIVIALDQPAVWPPPYIGAWPSVAVAYIEDNDPITNQPPHVAIIRPPDQSVFVAPVDITLVARAWDADGRVRTVEFFDGAASLGVVRNPHWPPLARVDALAQANDPSFLLDPEIVPDLEIIEPSPIPLDLFRLVWSNAPPGLHTVTAVATDNRGAQTTATPIHFTVLEVQPRPVVTVRASDPEAAEPVPTGPAFDTATFTLHRTGPTDSSLTVWYRITGTASNGEDYDHLPSMATIAEGVRTCEIVVRPIDDNLVEGDESVVLTVVPPICIDIYPPPLDCYLVGEPHAAQAVIHDNDTPPNRPPVVRIVRPEDGEVLLAPADVRIVAQAWDFDGQVDTVEFFEGTTSLGIVTNRLFTADPASLTSIATWPLFTLVWSNVPPGDYVLTAVATDNEGAQGRARPVEIKVVRPVPLPVVNIIATDPLCTEPGVLPVYDPIVFQVSRTGPTDQPLPVFYRIGGTASNGVDYRGTDNRPLPSRVVLMPGFSETNIEAAPIHDTLVEGTETVILELVPPPILSISNVVVPGGIKPVDAWYLVGSNHVARAAIRDNDFPPTNTPPKVAITKPESGEVFLAPADIPIVVAACDPDGWVHTIEFFEGNNLLGVVTNYLESSAAGTADLAQLFRLLWKDVMPGDYVLTALATDNRGASTVSDPVRIRVIGPRPPVVTIVATDPCAAEGPLPIWDDPIPVDPSLGNGTVGYLGPPISISNHVDAATLTVRRSGNTNVDLAVSYTVGGTASNGADYRQLSGRVLIPRGAWEADIVVWPVDDDLLEPTETVIVKLEPIDCVAVVPPPPDCYIVGDPDHATAFIRDNDINLPPKAEIVQPADGAVFVAPADVQIDVLTVDPNGWVTTVQFYAGGVFIGERVMMFLVPPPPGQPQTFSLVWSNAPAGPHVLTAKAIDNLGAAAWTDPVNIRVISTPIPVVTIVASDPVATEPDPRAVTPIDTAEFQVTRTGDLSEPLTVFYRVSGTASNGIDYRELPGRAVIPANEAAAPIVVVPVDDNLVEDIESVIVTLEQLRCVTTDVPPPEGCYIVGVPGRAVAYIRDNDATPNHPPKVALINPPDGATFTAPADIQLVAVAEDADGWVRTVEFFEGTHSLGIVTNHAWIVEPVRLQELNGAVLSGLTPVPIPLPPPFRLWWSNVLPGQFRLTAVATDNEGASTRSAPVTITVLPSSHVPIVNIVATDACAREGTTNTARFRIRRIGPTDAPLTVLYSISGTAENGVDYETIASPAIIPAGHRSAWITIRPIDDRIPEPLETVILSLRPSPVDPPTYRIGCPPLAAAIIADNDHLIRARQRLADGNLHFRLPQPSGLPYRLEATQDFLSWYPVIDNGVVSDDGVDFVEAEHYPCRFYRVMPEVEVGTEEE
jgi:hypothetical protein